MCPISHGDLPSRGSPRSPIHCRGRRRCRHCSRGDHHRWRRTAPPGGQIAGAQRGIDCPIRDQRWRCRQVTLWRPPAPWRISCIRPSAPTRLPAIVPEFAFLPAMARARAGSTGQSPRASPCSGNRMSGTTSPRANVPTLATSRHEKGRPLHQQAGQLAQAVRGPESRPGAQEQHRQGRVRRPQQHQRARVRLSSHAARLGLPVGNSSPPAMSGPASSPALRRS